MAFSIQARYPLGTYRGRRPDLTPERIPSVARLHAALLAAAGFGPRAVESDGEWAPSDVDEAALRWLEENPPTDVRVPRLRVTSNDAIVYRNDGTIGKSKSGKNVKKLPKQDSAVAVDGPFVWTWRPAPPEPIAEALRALCPDVPHLGPAESPVVLDVVDVADDEIDGTHEYVADAGLWAGGPGERVDLPARGRFDELVAAHRAERAGKVGGDKPSTGERSRSPVPPRTAVRTGVYRPRAHRIVDVPWTEVLLVPLDQRVAEQDRVRVAVAAHRALIRQLDRDAPPVVTGAYPHGARRPANRVGLQVLDSSYPVDLPGGAPSALAVLIPRDGAGPELAAVYRAVEALRDLHPWGRAGRWLRVRGREMAPYDGGVFWGEPAPGTVRLWRTGVPAVPDTRGHDGWTFVQAALLSLGFVWQGTPALPPAAGRGAARDTAIVDAVNAAGVAVLAAHPVHRSRVDRYVHRVNPHAVVRPYRALLHLGDLGGPGTIQAIGQCRHLGGGLLVPDDRPEGEIIGGQRE